MKSYPVILVLGLIQIPNTVKVALAVLIGFTDIFIPYKYLIILKYHR